MNNPSKRLIAYVDINQKNCQKMGEIIQNQGYDSLCIQQPLQVVPILLLTCPNLILLDEDLPIINVYELTAQIRRVDRFKRVPIVLITTQESRVNWLRAKLVGVTDVIAKPMTYLQLGHSIEKFLATDMSFNLDLALNSNHFASFQETLVKTK
jgi:two-component system, chemotaxis family, response regulator PixG